MNKIAVCFFGQPRFVRNTRAVVAHNKELFAKYDCDVFVHTWYDYADTVRQPSSTWTGLGDVNFNIDDVKDIYHCYHPKVLMTEKPIDFINDPHVEKTYNDIWASGHPYFEYINFCNIFSQHYSISKVAYLPPVADYDAVVFTRFDMEIEKIPDLHKLEKNAVYIPNNHNNFPDTVMITTGMGQVWAQTLFISTENEKPCDIKAFKEISAESFKLSAFDRCNNIFAGNLKLIPCNMYGHVVRSY